jgi:hypothetical protein
MAEIVSVNSSSKVDWAAIFAGAVLATAVGLILLTFGAGLGLGVTSPYEGEGLAPAFYVFAAGLWLLWVQLVAFTIGGYVTARLRTRQADATEHEVDVRDGLHGLLTWGVGVIAAAIIAFAGIGGITAAAEGSDGRDVIGAIATAAAQEVDEAAAAEPAVNAEAADETLTERRAETARKLTVISAFITAASLLAGAAAAFYAAGVGGKHRDQNTQLTFFVLRR